LPAAAAICRPKRACSTEPKRDCASTSQRQFPKAFFRQRKKGFAEGFFSPGFSFAKEKAAQCFLSAKQSFRKPFFKRLLFAKQKAFFPKACSQRVALPFFPKAFFLQKERLFTGNLASSVFFNRFSVY
jgi:hypothetical protein